MDAVGGFLIILILIIWGLFKLFGDVRRNAIAKAEREAYQAKITSKEYLAEREKERQETIKGYEKLAKEAEEDPDQNIWDNNYFDMRKVHFARLEKFGRSKFNGETYYIGSRGGIYTISANGTRNYKY